MSCSHHHLLLSVDGSMDWRELQTLVRSMPGLHKTLIVANVAVDQENNNEFVVQEVAVATEHAPFRHRKYHEVGSQVKRQKKSTDEMQNMDKSPPKDGS